MTTATTATTQPTTPVVGIHLDLKYLMPRKRYLLRWVKEIADAGVNTLLLEYEDKFPFSPHRFLRADGCFSPRELRRFLEVARGVGLRIVPLVQTISHLEFALEHKELKSLRELPEVTTQICPLNPKAVDFVRGLIDQVLEYHKEDEWFHLGSDEAWHLGHCPKCAEVLKTQDKLTFWGNHVSKLVQHVIAAGKRPLVWDDIYWGEPEKTKESPLPRQTILASWNYGAQLAKFDPNKKHRTEVYKEAGFEALSAPCYNWGQLTPMHDHCLGNTAYWAKQGEHSKLLGMINTSWACFHTPLPTQDPYLAATAGLMRGEDAASDAWQAAWAGKHLGIKPDLAATVPVALRDLGVTWEFSVEGLGRPIAPIVYGYMDMAALYKGGQKERQARGAYPLDWAECDFVELYRKKIGMLKAGTDQPAIRKKLDDLRVVYERAQAALRPIADKARKHKEYAQLLALDADTKALHVRILDGLLFGQGDLRAALADLTALQPRMMEVLKAFYEDSAIARINRLMWEPATKVLQETLAGQ